MNFNDDSPKVFQSKNGKPLVIKHLTDESKEEALNFLNRLPADEREYLWDDPNDPGNIELWVELARNRKLVCLVAEIDGRIVSIWTLGLGDHGWTRHLGYLWGIVDPSERRNGVGTVCVRELLSYAGKFEMERVVLELVRPQKGPLVHFSKVGFSEAATLKSWVKDRQGRYHDLLVLTMELEPAWRKMDELLASYDSHAN